MQPISVLLLVSPGEAAPLPHPRIPCHSATQAPTVTLGTCHLVVVGPLMQGQRLEEMKGFFLGIKEWP